LVEAFSARGRREERKGKYKERKKGEGRKEKEVCRKTGKREKDDGP